VIEVTIGMIAYLMYVDVDNCLAKMMKDGDLVEIL
jgi:hypothetical protein